MIYRFKRGINNIFYCENVNIVFLKDTYYEIKPYIKEDTNNGNSNEKYKIGVKIKEMIKGIGDQYEVKKNQRETNKQFTLNSKVLNYLVNLESAIIDKIINLDYFELNLGIFELDFDINETYVRHNNLNERIRKYLLTFDNLSLDEDLIFDVEVKTKVKLLNSFKIELLNAMKLNEKDIEKVLKKYQDFLPLIIPGINASAKFQYIIDVQGYKRNIADIMIEGQEENTNIIELKKATFSLFKKGEYRNNSCKLTPEFSNAIQQANIQRCMIASSDNNPYNANSKTFLLIGNLKKEIENHDDQSVDIKLNFNVVKYNNKDCEIITYDKVIDRIEIILSKLKSTQT